MRGRAQLALLLAAACAEPRPQRSAPPPAFSPASATAPVPAPSAGAALPEAPRATPSTVSFEVGKPIRFRGGAPLRLQPIAKQTAIHALSPDAKSWVIDGPNNTVQLVTPRLPRGVSHPVWVPSALFSDDGSQALIWSTSDLAVIEVASGRFLGKREGAICAARFSGPNEIVFHESSKEPTARLWRWRLGTPAAVPLGAAREADYCHVSADGTSWLVESYAARWYLDGKSGGARALPPPAKGGTLSPAGNRVCVGDDNGFSCVRYPDERTESVWSKPTSDYMVFDGAGAHVMIQYAAGPDSVRSSFALVDFATLTVRPLEGVKGMSGSTFALTPGAKLITIGSGSGLWVYDVERAEKRFAAHRPLYGNHVFPHHPRRVVAGTDEPMDLFLVDVP